MSRIRPGGRVWAIEAESIPGRGAPRGLGINSIALGGVKGHCGKSSDNGEAKAQGETQGDGNTLAGLDETEL